jgi:hypothetical protein
MIGMRRDTGNPEHWIPVLILPAIHPDLPLALVS